MIFRYITKKGNGCLRDFALVTAMSWKVLKDSLSPSENLMLNLKVLEIKMRRNQFLTRWITDTWKQCVVYKLR